MPLNYNLALNNQNFTSLNLSTLFKSISLILFPRVGLVSSSFYIIPYIIYVTPYGLASNNISKLSPSLSLACYIIYITPGGYGLTPFNLLMLLFLQPLSVIPYIIYVTPYGIASNNISNFSPSSSLIHYIIYVAPYSIASNNISNLSPSLSLTLFIIYMSPLGYGLFSYHGGLQASTNYAITRSFDITTPTQIIYVTPQGVCLYENVYNIIYPNKYFIVYSTNNTR